MALSVGTDEARDNALETIGRWTVDFRASGAGCTVTDTVGYWDGARETGIVVRFDWPETDPYTGRTLWGELVDMLADALPNERFGHETSYVVDFAEVALQVRRGRRANHFGEPCDCGCIGRTMRDDCTCGLIH